MKILEEIKKEHDEVRDLMLKLENDEKKAAGIFNEMAVTILAHHEAEEHVVFVKLPDEKEARISKWSSYPSTISSGRRSRPSLIPVLTMTTGCLATR